MEIVIWRKKEGTESLTKLIWLILAIQKLKANCYKPLNNFLFSW